MPKFPSVTTEGAFESPEINEKIKGLARDAVDTSTFAAKSDLNDKADTTHSHTISDVTDLQSALDGKQASGSYATAADLNGKANTDHTHDVADVTGLQTALDGKQDAGDYATSAVVEALDGVVADLAARIEALESPTG